MVSQKLSQRRPFRGFVENVQHTEIVSHLAATLCLIESKHHMKRTRHGPSLRGNTGGAAGVEAAGSKSDETRNPIRIGDVFPLLMQSCQHV